MEVEARRCTYLSLVVGVKCGPKSGVAMANAFCNSSSIKNCRIVCFILECLGIIEQGCNCNFGEV